MIYNVLKFRVTSDIVKVDVLIYKKNGSRTTMTTMSHKHDMGWDYYPSLNDHIEDLPAEFVMKEEYLRRAYNEVDRGGHAQYEIQAIVQRDIAESGWAIFEGSYADGIRTAVELYASLFRRYRRSGAWYRIYPRTADDIVSCLSQK